GIGLLLEEMLRDKEGPGQDRRIRRIGPFEAPGDFGRTHDLDILDEFVSCPAPCGEFRVVDEVEIELPVLRREGRAVMPFHIVAKLDAPSESIFGYAAI